MLEAGECKIVSCLRRADCLGTICKQMGVLERRGQGVGLWTAVIQAKKDQVALFSPALRGQSLIWNCASFSFGMSFQVARNICRSEEARRNATWTLGRGANPFPRHRSPSQSTDMAPILKRRTIFWNQKDFIQPFGHENKIFCLVCCLTSVV